MPVDVHPAAVPFQKTFLKDHILEQLCSARVLGDILALEELRNGVLRRAASAADPTAAEEVERRLPEVLSLQDFFYEAWPDQQVYLPVPVFHVDTLRRYSELTELLQKDQSGCGIVLLARSGAGKTVAQRKAFCDCFYSKPDANAPPESNKPRLADHLPCWVNLRGRLRETDLIEYLLWDTAGLESSAAVPDSIRAWLECGPRLLLFCDLNVLGFADRLRVADAIATFQASWAKNGHRCVVAYRSMVANDGVMDLLKADFDFYDMRPLLEDQAASYLANIRRYEQRVYENLSVPWPERDVEAESLQIRNLLTHLTVFGGQQESVISTPLLMHFASLLDPEAMKRVRTLTDLYDAVVNLHLDREQVKYARARRLPFGPAGKELVKVAMTRTALAMQACAGRTTLTEAEFSSLMLQPEQDVDGKHWWPDDRFWHQSSYYDRDVLPGDVSTRKDQMQLLQSLREFSLLRRREGSGLGFLHDSLIYYFAAVGLREYRGAGAPPLAAPLPKEWFPNAVCRMHRDAQRWLLSAEFLGTMLAEEDLLALVREFILTDPTPETPHLLWRLFRGAGDSLPVGTPSRLRVVRDALLRDLQFLTRHPQALFQCLWNRCWWYDCPDAEKHYEETPPCLSLRPWKQPVTKLYELLENWRKALETTKPGFCWLRALRPLPDSLLGGPRLVIRGHTDAVNSVTLSHDGKRIASGSNDGTIRVWDSENGCEIVVMGDAYGWQRVTKVAFSRDFRRIVSSHWEDCVCVWDAERGNRLAAHSIHLGELALSPDGRHIAVWGGLDGSCVKLYDVADGRKVLVLDQHEGVVRSVAFSPDGRRIAVGCDNYVAGDGDIETIGIIRLWDLKNATEVLVLRGHEDCVCDVAYSTDGRRIASGSYDKTLRVWDAENGDELHALRGHEREVRSISFSLDGQWVASGGGDNTVRVWDAQYGHECVAFRGHEDAVNSVAFSPDGRWITSGSMDRTVRLWNLENSATLQLLRGHKRKITDLVIAPDFQRIASGSEDASVLLWNPETGAQLAVLRHDDVVRVIAYSPDGSRIASGSADGNVYVWDGENGNQLQVMRGHKGDVLSLSFSPNGQHIASASSDETVRVWDVATGAQLRVLHGHDDIVNCVAFSPNGSQIASGSGRFQSAIQSAKRKRDNSVRIWDANTGSQLAVLLGHTKPVCSLKYSPDGCRIASGSADGTVRVWDPESGAEILVLPDSHERQQPLDRVEYSPHESLIVASTKDTWMYVWDGVLGDRLGIIQGGGDVYRIAGGLLQPGFRVLARQFETLVEPSSTDQPIAFFHMPLNKLKYDPLTMTFAGTSGEHLYIVRLEGAQKPISDKDVTDEDAESLATLKQLSEQPCQRPSEWYYLGAQFVHFGDYLVKSENIPGSLGWYRRALKILKCLVKLSLDSEPLQHDVASVHSKIGDSLLAQKELSAALGEYRASLAIRQRLFATCPGDMHRQDDLVETHEDIAHVLWEQGDYSAALTAYQAALAIQERLVAQDFTDPKRKFDLFKLHATIGDVLLRQGNLPDALRAYRTSLMIQTHLAEIDPVSQEVQHWMSDSHDAIGYVLHRQGELTDALDEYRTELAILNRLAAQGAKDVGWKPDISSTHSFIAHILVEQGRFSEALTEYQNRMAILERLAAEDAANFEWQGDISMTYADIGFALLQQGELAGASAAYRAALAIQERLAATEPANRDWQRDLSGRHLGLGHVFLEQEKLTEALGEYRAALAIQDRLTNHRPADLDLQHDLSKNHANIGCVLHRQGQLPCALDEYRAELAILARLTVQDAANAAWQEDMAAAHDSIGEILLEQGEIAEALAAYEASIAIQEQLSAKAPNDTELLHDLALFHGKLARLSLQADDRTLAMKHYRACRRLRLDMRQRGKAEDMELNTLIGELNALDADDIGSE